MVTNFPASLGYAGHAVINIHRGIDVLKFCMCIYIYTDCLSISVFL